MNNKKTSMADHIFNEWTYQTEKQERTKAGANAKISAERLVKNFNMKKSKEKNLKIKEKGKDNLINKLDSCDWTDSKLVSKVINDYIKFSKNHVDERDGSKELIVSFKNFLRRAKIIETKSMIKLIESLIAWKLEISDNPFQPTIEVDPFDYLNKCKIDDELVYRVILAGRYSKLKELWIWKELLEKSFNRFKNFLRNNLENLDYALKWQSCDFTELFWECHLLVTGGLHTFIFDNFSECWELDEEILKLLLKSGYDIMESDYKYFRWIKKENFLNILHERKDKEIEDDE